VVKEKRREPQRHKEHKGLDVINYLCGKSEEEIKKMDRILGSYCQLYNPSF
jgi:hypothetical protein